MMQVWGMKHPLFLEDPEPIRCKTRLHWGMFGFEMTNELLNNIL